MSWLETTHRRVRLLNKQIAFIYDLSIKSGMSEDDAEKACLPYYSLLDEIYQNEMPLARILEHSDLVLHVEGKSASKLNPKASIVAGIIKDAKDQIACVAKAFANIMNTRGIPDELELDFTGLAPGSIYVGFSVTKPEDYDTDQISLDQGLYEATRNAIKGIGVAARIIASRKDWRELESEFPNEVERNALMKAIYNLSPSTRKGIDSVSISGGMIGDGVLTPDIRVAIKDYTEITEDVDNFVVEGRLREIDLDKREFEIRSIANLELRKVKFSYAKELDLLARGALDKYVMVKSSKKPRRSSETVVAQSIDVIRD
jgi:hypothetical protein